MLCAIDLCCGAGGWACAARQLPIRVELAVDVWLTACKTYELNHPSTRVLCGDLRKPEVSHAVTDFALANKVDLVVGGIPCEWLSVYRSLEKVKPHELDAQRATLDAVLELVQAIAPPYWCLEDVTGLINELPILTPYQVIRSERYSPQRRKRVYVGSFPAPEAPRCPKLLRDAVLPGPYRIGPRAFERNPVRRRSFTRTETLAAELDRKAPTVLAVGSRRDAELVVVDFTLPGGKRQLEWQEAAILQGFPRDYLFFGSPSDVAKMIGRAIQIDTGRAILGAIARHASAASALTPSSGG